MKNAVTAERTFNIKREERINPYIGFTSFQHFRGEKLYSDLVVLPENNFCETEKVECYPVSSSTEENGRAEGYYPDSSVVYIRVLWREFEPERGVYNYDFIDEIIKEAKAHGQSLIFRLMAHSTRAEDDVPYWLKELIPCPERPDGMRVKDSPTDPMFLELFCLAVRKFGERYDNEPTLDMIDISLPGAWGEGHNLHLYPADTLERIVDVYTDVFKKTRLCAQISRPELIKYANERAARPVGMRGDGFGHPKHMDEIYPPRIERVKDLWRSAPVSFEAYWWLGEWDRRGWDLDKIIERSLEWHISSFNAKSLPIPEHMREKVDGWIDRMGYHFAIDRVRYPSVAMRGEVIELEIRINNTGVAPIYEKLPLRIRLKGEGGEHTFVTDVDITRWLPGNSSERLNISLPSSLAPCIYEIGIGIRSEDFGMIYFATDAKRQGEFYTVGEINVN